MYIKCWLLQLDIRSQLKDPRTSHKVLSTLPHLHNQS